VPDTVLAAIARRLGRRPLTGEALERRFQVLKGEAEAPVPPATDSDVVCGFKTQALRNLFEISEVASLQQALAALQTHLPIAPSPQASLRHLPWGSYGHTLVETAAAPALGVVEASAGIAETGTVAVSSRETPSALLFLAEELVIVLRRENILAFQEQLWHKLRPGDCRALHLISGPSRTADVEQTLQVGAHGPRRVYLWLISEDSP